MLASASATTFPLVSQNNVAKADDQSSETPEPLTVIKAPLDDRDYEAFKLENGLRVLLCSDPSSTTAAAAMDVHVGACSDPDAIPGLAHFNEHMLFLGTKDYPKEESFSSFLSANGGSSNAFTSSEDTVYYFDMEAEADSKIGEGLLRFGSFFTNPLFTESATGRELNAIESENAKNLQSDVFRGYQIDKSRANSDHPFSKFFTGNKATLLEGTKKQGIDLRQELIKFYERYYSANQMTLAIVAPQSMDTLKGFVSEAFSAVPNRNTPKPELAWAGTNPFDNGNSVIPSLKHVVEVVPVMDLRQMNLKFPVSIETPSDQRDRLYTKPAFYVGHLLGHEGPGSLISYLKRQGWANGLGSSSDNELSDFETFEITVELTNKGLAAVDDVCGAIFAYIRMMEDRAIPNYVFDEVLNLVELEWRFLSKAPTGNWATSLAQSMQKYPPSLYVAGPRRLALESASNSRYDITSKPRSYFADSRQREITKASVSDLVSKFTVDNLMVTVMSKAFAGKTDKTEKWYGTAYTVRPIPESTLEKWRQPALAASLGIAYPKPNPFIPSESGLKVKKKVPKKPNAARTFESRMKPVSPPYLIRDDGDEGRWTVYYKQDDRFGQPKAFVIFQLLTSEVFSSAKSAVLAQLYQTCAGDRLEEYAYDASLAGLSYDVQVQPRGVRLTFGGYNDKLKKFAAYISDKLAKSFADVLPQDESEFERYRDYNMRSYNGFDVKQPYSHAIYFSGLTIQPLRFQYPNSELRDAIEEVTLGELTEYVQKLWSSGKGEALIQGNLEQEEALDLVTTIDKTLNFKTISASDYPPRTRALELPLVVKGSMPTLLTISEPNPSNRNSCSQVLIQSLGTSEKDHVLIEILASIIEEPFYENLRTKQQLGYIVSSGVKALVETRMLNLVVQSSVAPVAKLTTEILKFLDGVEKNYLDPLSPGDFAMYAKSLIDRKTEPDKTLAVEVTRNWAEISSGRFQFGRIQREAAALLELTKDDLIDFWRSIYSGGKNHVIISEIVPQTGAASSNIPPKSTGYASGQFRGTSLELGIDDIQRFRMDRDAFKWVPETPTEKAFQN